MDNFNIYMCGVGGQGIGLLNEILIRASENAGYNIKGVDTHGLAQRGGIVQSHLKLGGNIHSPLISSHDADLVIGLEVHEAYRSISKFIKPNGKLVFYNTEWQPSEVRLFNKGRISVQMLNDECNKRGLSLYEVLVPDLPSSKMQNIAIIAEICKSNLIPKSSFSYTFQHSNQILGTFVV